MTDDWKKKALENYQRKYGISEACENLAERLNLPSVEKEEFKGKCTLHFLEKLKNHSSTCNVMGGIYAPKGRIWDEFNQMCKELSYEQIKNEIYQMDEERAYDLLYGIRKVVLKTEYPSTLEEWFEENSPLDGEIINLMREIEVESYIPTDEDVRQAFLRWAYKKYIFLHLEEKKFRAWVVSNTPLAKAEFKIDSEELITTNIFHTPSKKRGQDISSMSGLNRSIPLLKASEYIIESFQDKFKKTKNKIYLVAIKHVKSLIKEEVKVAEYPFYVPQKVIRQQRLVEGEAYLKEGDVGFSILLKKKYYEGIVYEIKCNLPDTLYSGKTYIGITGRGLETRFREHVVDSIRECVRTNNTPGSGYTKIRQAIANSLIKVGWNINTLYDTLRTLRGSEYYIYLNSLIKSIKNRYITYKILEIHYEYNTLFERERFYIKNLETTKRGLNEYEGGGLQKKFIRLPLYDIAMLIALGKNKAQITDVLNKMYPFNVSKLTVSNRIQAFFGGWYEAQIKFLKPIIEQLFLDGFSGHDIYRFVEDVSGQHQDAWFNDWRWGDVFLDVDIKRVKNQLESEGLTDFKDVNLIDRIDKRYFGIPQSQWIKWAVENVSGKEIKKNLGFSGKTITEIYKKIGGSHGQVQRKHRRTIAIDLMRNKGWSFHKIFTDAFKKAPKTSLKRAKLHARYYFENSLFPGMTIEEIYKKYNRDLWLQEVKEIEEKTPRPSQRIKELTTYPTDLEGSLPLNLVNSGYITLSRDKTKIRKFPHFLRYLIIGFIYKTLKESTALTNEELLQKILEFAEKKNLTIINNAMKERKLKSLVESYFESLVEVVREIKRRVDNSESLYRSKIIDYFRENDIRIQFSPPIINDIIWNLRHLYPEDFRGD